MRRWRFSRRGCLLALTVAAWTAVSSPAASAEPDKGPSAPRPATHTVKKELLRIDVSFDGVFEAQEMAEISLTPKSWTTLTIQSAVEHGALVNAGDLLVSLEMEKIDREIEDLRLENETSAVALSLAEQELAALEKNVAMDLASGERTEKEVREDLEYYFGTSRPWAQRTADFSMKSSEQYLDYQREELEQLEKMYQADDLTEETEDLILRRTRDDLERSQFSLERSRVQHDRTVDVSLPRQDADIKESAERFELSWAEAKAALPLVLQRERLDLERQKTQRARSLERLEDLRADRAAMTVKAPMSGVVYYGKCVRGKFSGNTSDNALRPGGSLPTKQAFMTIVKPRPMFVRANVAERDLHAVRGGLEGTAVPTGFPDLRLTAIVDSVATIPAGSGTFDTRVTVALGPEAEPVKPGMTCKVKIVSYEKKDALTVPPRCLQTDDEDERQQVVYLLDEQRHPQKRSVTVGKRTAAKVEILEGLAEGDQVLLAPPKDEEQATEKQATEKQATEKQATEKPDAEKPDEETKAPDETEPDAAKEPAEEETRESPTDGDAAAEEGA